MGNLSLRITAKTVHIVRVEVGIGWCQFEINTDNNSRLDIYIDTVDLKAGHVGFGNISGEPKDIIANLKFSDINKQVDKDQLPPDFWDTYWLPFVNFIKINWDKICNT